MRRETTNALNCFFCTGTKEEVVTIQERHKHLWVFDIRVEAIAMQFQVADNLRPQQAYNVGTGGHRKARKWLFERTCTAYAIPLLQNGHFFPCTRQVTCCNKPIMSSANNDSIDLPGLIHHENEAPFEWNEGMS